MSSVPSVPPSNVNPSNAPTPAAASTIPTWSLADNPKFLVHMNVVQGVGTAAIGIDRGDSTPGLLARVDEVPGGGFAITAENTGYGYTDGEDALAFAAKNSFAESVLVGDASDDAGAFDPTGLGFVDYLRVAQTLSNFHQVTYELKRDLSRVQKITWFDDILAIDTVLTFGVVEETPKPRPGGMLNATGPAPGPVSRGFPAPADTVSITQRVTLRPLPDDDFEPMAFHGRIGSMGMVVVNRFDRQAEQDSRTVLAPKYRLKPGADNAPIVYRLDPGIPEPFRSAMLEGFNWWQEAFAEAGFPDVYRVEILPEGQDLFDPRYGTITWAHRSDRGWSFGKSHQDPRTGEILKGCVVMGSQRIEEIRAITEAVLGVYGTDREDEVTKVVCARLASLSAHEVGHSLGFAHNFASHHHTQQSVMDYPGPSFGLDAEGLPCVPDLATAPYSVGMGPWDLHSVKALYHPDLAGPVGIGAGGSGDGLEYVTDADSRLEEYADARASTWKGWGEALDSFENLVAVRKAALARFGTQVVKEGSDSNELERRFRLLYLVHRFHAVSAAKAIGGTVRTYAETAFEGYEGAVGVVPLADQLAALESVAVAFSPAFLEVPAHVVPLLAPPAGGVAMRDGGFAHRTAGSADTAAIVRAGTDVIVGMLLAPQRLNRVAEQSTEVLEALLGKTIGWALGVLDGGAVPGGTGASGEAGASGGSRTATTIAWAILQRFTASLTSTVLHEQVRFEILGLLADTGEDLTSPLVKKKWEKVVDQALATVDELPAVPLGTPI
ncbi:zinc-dependent metalloprotease [Brevibacterium samyangense]|uniref:zinc-dependent metalloprotease n=1 Tax=Brevibacterium samyangense TaxID=366888 RepID=UPI0031E3F885